MTLFVIVLVIACRGAPLRTGNLAPPASAANSGEAKAQIAASEQAEGMVPREPVEVAARASIALSDLATHRRFVGLDVQVGLRELVDELVIQGNLWVGPLAGNGGRDVLIYIPPGASDAAAFRLIFHFHGTSSQHIQRRAPGIAKESWVGWDRLAQTLDGARALQLAVPDNIALIYPLSAGKRIEPEWQGWSNKIYDRMWMRPAPPNYTDDFSVLHGEAVQILTRNLGVHPSKIPARVLVEGHSAGGIALWNIARSGTELVSDYLFLDAGFYSWADGCHAEIRGHGTNARVVLVIRDGGIADPIRGPDPWCVDMPMLAASWPEVRATCTADPKLRPRGGGVSCARWRALAEDWPRVAPWCEAMKNDMREIDDVMVLWTKTPHAKQPGTFFGGLQIPALLGTSTASPSRFRRETR